MLLGTTVATQKLTRFLIGCTVAHVKLTTLSSVGVSMRIRTLIVNAQYSRQWVIAKPVLSLTHH